jgi:hypothetical protein
VRKNYHFEIGVFVIYYMYCIEKNLLKQQTMGVLDSLPRDAKAQKAYAR